MIPTLDSLVEARIREAQARGAFDDLPGAGRPLELDDDRLVPEELRAAYRVLKNAGFVPPEVDALRAVASVDPASRRAAALALLLEARGVRLASPLVNAYRERLLRRIGHPSAAGGGPSAGAVVPDAHAFAPPPEDPAA